MIHRRRRRRGGLLAVLVVSILLGACGGDGSAADDTPSTTTERDDSGTTPLSTSGPAPADATLPPVEGPFAEGRTQIPGFGEVEVRIVDGPDGEPVVLCVLVADTPAQRQRGLMEVTDLGGYDGMLFRFDDEAEGGFWMEDTLLPLSIAYLDADGAVVSTADMDPCPPAEDACPSYPAEGPYRMALEVEQGGLAPLGLAEGSDARLEVGGACSPRTAAD
ncbi:DUF192 domain-containing protein [Iamia sp. SCSIO 61187]|uniref:DUF192 domain-containing protein n=1 Tax=Iamia sp. SCSIO 61187 TaxID=2722752 RepID=UPI001C637D84|nr:DUF192 domain-containing protein [Iamia sp. SCSIO 61187]QYG95276.1 DUF192 domain-containing protein [Iamia sp. SCSIO 61187]